MVQAICILTWLVGGRGKIFLFLVLKKTYMFSNNIVGEGKGFGFRLTVYLISTIMVSLFANYFSFLSFFNCKMKIIVPSLEIIVRIN